MSEWVSIEKELPPLGKPVLTWCGPGVIAKFSVNIFYLQKHVHLDGEERFVWVSLRDTIECSLEYIKKWQFLPEVPETIA